MKRLKVVVYAICKNESTYVKQWMRSMSEADEVIVTDTGSSDDTVEQLRQAGAKVYIEQIDPWRFDEARNRSLGHVPDDTDICVCTDLDEAFEPGWRKRLEKGWEPGTTMVNYLYNWSLKEDGSPDVQFQYFKIHARDQYIWQYPVHECLKYIGQGPEQKLFIENVVLNHYQDRQKSRSSYLGLLETAVDEMPDDSRMRYYLGREYMYKGEWQKCRDTLEAYLNLPSSRWKEERCAAMRWIAKSCYRMGRTEQAYQWYFRAVGECPGMRDAYIECAQMAYSLADWDTVFYMVRSALKIKEKTLGFTNMGYSWDYTPYDLLAISSYHLGLYDLSYEYAQKAAKIAPGKKRLIDNVKVIMQKMKS